MPERCRCGKRARAFAVCVPNAAAVCSAHETEARERGYAIVQTIAEVEALRTARTLADAATEHANRPVSGQNLDRRA